MGFIKYKDTEKLENAYAQFGKVAYVDRWFKADCFKADPIRNADFFTKVVELNRLISKKSGKPMWYLPVIQLEYRPAERLKMSKKLDFALIYSNKWTDKISASTAFELERIARKKPKKDWRVELIDAFESLTYQRQGRNKWVLIEIGKGYA